MIHMGEYSDALTRDALGIWRTSTRGAVSYPEDDNAVCFQIEDHSPWFRHRNDCLMAAVRRFPPSGPIVEIGAGNGFVARRFIDEGFPCAVLEPGPVGARNAKTQRGIEDVICATLQDARFKAGSLAAAGLFDVLEHIEDDRGVVDELARVLRPGGFVYLTVPSPPWLYSIKDVDAQHYRRYSIPGITAVFGARFEVAYATYFFSALTLPTLLLRAIPYRLGLARSRSSESYAAEHTRAQQGGGVMARLFKRELEAIGAGRSRTFGTSLLLVARRRAD